MLIAIQFFFAVLVGGVYFVGKEIWNQSRPLRDAIFGRTPKVSDEIYRKRLEVCRKCEVYFKPLATCGSPLRGKRDGCMCFMPLKARYECNCWAWEEAKSEAYVDEEVFETLGFWSHELNSDYEEDQH